MTADYVLTTAAEADLRDLIRYTRKQWGDAQARVYVAKLTRGIERIATGQTPFKALPTIHSVAIDGMLEVC